MDKLAGKFYECGICDHLHRWEFNGDCREDAQRFCYEDLADSAEVAGWDDRLAEDGQSLELPV